MVTGRLGGPIYDVVYRVEVPAGYVLVAGLTGTAGTDFDLYLFDASATTVLSPWASSRSRPARRAASRSSWPTRIGGTFYLDLNGATDVEGTYTLSVRVVPDPTPPQASLLVAGGLTRVNTPQVTLLLAGFDDLSGVTEMSLSYDGLSYLPAEPLRNQFEWTLSAGDGPKTIWVRVINGVGLASAPASVTVQLDTAGPTVTSATPANGATVTDARPTISVRFSEAIDAASWSTGGLIVQSSSGGILPGAYLYYPSIRTGTFIPSTDLAPGYVYFVTVGDVRDLAGNRVVGSSWTLKRLLPASVTVAATPSVVVVGSSVTLAGAASIPAGESLALDAREGARDGVRTDPHDRSERRPLRPHADAGAEHGLPRELRGLRDHAGRVRVRPGARAAEGGAARSRIFGHADRGGRPVRDAHRAGWPRGRGPGLVPALPVRRGTARATSSRGASVVRPTRSGRARLTWTPSAGRFAWRVAVSSTVDYANNLSPALSLVRQPLSQGLAARSGQRAAAV